MSFKPAVKPLKILILVAVILLLIFFNSKGWLAGPKNILSLVFSPVLKFFQWTSEGITDGLTFVFTIKDLARENYRLKEENKNFWGQITAFKETTRENEIFRQRLAIGQAEKEKAVFGRVIGYDPQAVQYLIINQGKEAGIKEGLAVVSAHNFLVGKILSAEKNFAKVLLITDAECAINVLIQETRISGLLKGEHGLGVIMDMISLNQLVSNGETIITSGLDKFIPAGLLVGRVKEAVAKEAEIFQKISVEPAADLKKIESVFVIIR